MNATQIDKAVSASANSRIVGYAVGVALHRKLGEGFLCGLWSPRRKAYAVLRPPGKRGRRSKLSTKQVSEFAVLFATVRTAKLKIRELMQTAGASKETVRKAVARLNREQLAKP